MDSESPVVATGLEGGQSAPRISTEGRPTLLPAGAAALLLAAVGTGAVYGQTHPRWRIDAPPFFADWGLGSPLRLIPAALVAAGGWWWLTRTPQSRPALKAGLVAAAWGAALLWADGAAGVVGVSGPYDYLTVLPVIDRIGWTRFVSGFTAALPSYPIHVQGHPPGFPLLLHALAGLGASGVASVLLLAVSGWAAAVGCAVKAADLLRPGGGRLAAPWLALAPAALWLASADGFFAGLVAIAILVVSVASLRAGSGSLWIAAGGGALGGVALLFTYGAAPLVVLGGLIAAAKKRWGVLAMAAAGGVAVLVTAALAGFSWLEGLQATRTRYYAGVSADRPYQYFVWANLAVLAVMIGPVALRGLGHLRANPDLLTVLVGGAVVAVLLADVSGLSKGEVERIWLPFVPWVILAGAQRISARRAWLVSTVAVTFSVQLLVRSPW